MILRRVQWLTASIPEPREKGYLRVLEGLATVLSKGHRIFTPCSAPVPDAGYGQERVLTVGTQNCKPREESRPISVGLWLGEQGNPLV